MWLILFWIHSLRAKKFYKFSWLNLWFILISWDNENGIANLKEQNTPFDNFIVHSIGIENIKKQENLIIHIDIYSDDTDVHTGFRPPRENSPWTYKACRRIADSGIGWLENETYKVKTHKWRHAIFSLFDTPSHHHGF